MDIISFVLNLLSYFIAALLPFSHFIQTICFSFVNLTLYVLIVRVSLLTMTSPNQMHEVLLFVY